MWLHCENVCLPQCDDINFVLMQLGVMTYGDTSKQSPETQAAIEQEVRSLLKVSLSTARIYHMNITSDHF